MTSSPDNPFRDYVRTIQQLAKDGRNLPLATFQCRPSPAPRDDAPRMFIFSPHPDDEVVIGGLALRLLQESGWKVTNVAVTLGSNPKRQYERWEELRQCCERIGFDLLATAPHGLERIRPTTRKDDPRHWQQCVDIIAQLLREHTPDAIMFPHNEDWNSTHEGVHWLLHDALKAQNPGFSCITIETEYWGAMDSPNLMVEITADQLGDLITALTYHKGEVQRNPYHLTVPAWMMDNVRRGAELVGGQGGASPDYTFATLYRARRWTAESWTPLWPGGFDLPASTPAGSCLPHA